MVGSGKMIAKEFIAAHPPREEFTDPIDEMHCLLHLDHEMRERMVENERIMILQIDTLNKMLKQLEVLQVNLTSSNNRMAGSMDNIAMQIKNYISKDYSLV